MCEQLEELRKLWEGDMDIVAEFGSERNHTFVVVLAMWEGMFQKFWVNRYFKIGDNWNISVDADNVRAEDAFKFAAMGVNIEMNFSVDLEKEMLQKVA